MRATHAARVSRVLFRPQLPGKPRELSVIGKAAGGFMLVSAVAAEVGFFAGATGGGIAGAAAGTMAGDEKFGMLGAGVGFGAGVVGGLYVGGAVGAAVGGLTPSVLLGVGGWYCLQALQKSQAEEQKPTPPPATYVEKLSQAERVR